ncbi:hypothetical protein MKZ38_007031 [Zalerion maritima]|uniref:Carrier domain-containing protein n=1 Tax=Zalerion maritima TaxID=339359 RepID=A0AAD5RWV1_9PEZI|nr:hypothetical protein MKZ38_007031 [Zalerion maritima]
MRLISIPLEGSRLSGSLAPGYEVDWLLLAWVVLLDRYHAGSEVSFVWGPSRTCTARMSTANVSLSGTNPVSEVVDSVHSSRENHSPAGYDISSSQPHMYVALDSDPQDGASQPQEQHGLTRFEATISPDAISVSFPQFTPRLQADAFRDVLIGMLSDVRKPLSSVALLPTKRDMEIIWSWNSNLPPTIPRCMHELIAERTAASPDAPAVHAWDGDLTYRQLDTLSDSLARSLVSAYGVGTGTLVPLCFEKSVYAVATVLAVLKAGGGFVFLSPTQPLERLKTIMGEVGGSLIISSQRQAELALEIGSDARHFVVSEAGLRDQSMSPVTATLPSPAPDSVLYVIFTSGSTGKPKGVTISHTNYTSGAIPRAEAVGYKSTSRVLDFAAYVFDVSIDCILCTLACGGCICVPSEEDRMNSLGSVIQKLDVNMAHMTPSVARVLDSEVMSSLAVLGLGGEAVSAKDTAAWSQLTKVVVAYGPSECTVGCTINNDMRREVTPYASIGKGVGGATWIVDPEDHNRLVPVGAVGELLVEGPIVGKGYLNRPDLTEQVFISSPGWLLAGNGETPGRHGRLYKTGDLVSYSLDGSGKITFVSRKDQQVKIRGQRVELAEIEHNLREQLPERTGVAAEVISPRGARSEPMLAVFVSEDRSHHASPPSNPEEPLHSFSLDFDQALAQASTVLATRLPAYMVPSAYIPLVKMPTLVSCKTDRKKLREIGSSMTRPQLAKLRATPAEVGTKIRPETQKEILLSRLWSQVIGSDIDAAKNDSFFLLGGDSLKAMRLVAAARKEGMALTVGGVFSNPSLASMARVASLDKTNPSLTASEPEPFSLLPPCWDAMSLKEEAAKLCKVDTGEVEDIYPCTPLQEGLMALSAKIQDAYVAQRVVRLKDSSVASRLQEAFDTTSAESSILRTRIVQIPFKGLLQVVTKGNIPWCAGTNLKQYLEDDREALMELGTALMRCALITDLQTGAVDFVLTIHHALYDGWSMQLVIERVNSAYQQVRLPRPTPFKSFIKYLDSQDRKASETYWREYLRGADGPQFPPHPHKGYQTKADSLLERYITLPKVQKAAHVTLATAIRAAWALISAKELQISDVVLGETLTGRNAPIPGVEGIEGPMITTVPMRVRVDDHIPITEFLQDIHQQTIARIPHENLGLQNIRRLGLDAREACELKAGLVLHPAEDQDQERGNPDDEPANGFVPADDAEAAREALKFNTYALMLVCSLDSKGFLVMASFDSQTVEARHMERLLRHMDAVIQAIYENRSGKLGDIDVVDEDDVDRIWQVSVGAMSSETKAKLDLPKDARVDSAWVVSPNDTNKLLPVGAIGEIVVECLDVLPLDRVHSPNWHVRGHENYPGKRIQLYKTGRVGKYTQNGPLLAMGSSTSWAKPQAPRSLSAKPKPPATAAKKDASKLNQGTLLQLWARAVYLPDSEIDPDDSFFSLGGDSIGAMKLVSEARHLGLELTVADIFNNKTLRALEKVVKKIPSDINASAIAARPDTPENTKRTDSGYGSPMAPRSPSSPPAIPAEKPFSTLISGILHSIVRPQLRCGPRPEIVDVFPTRPLQDIAIQGTIQNPKFSVRYEMFHFPTSVDQQRLRSACKELVLRNEILRTVFVSSGLASSLAVVIKNLDIPFDNVELSVGGDVVSFARMWSNLDVQTTQPLGSPFVKFLLASTPKRATLVFRISHAQYDEMSLPGLLSQLAGLFSGAQGPRGLPFSAFASHATSKVQEGESMIYWRKLLDGAKWTSLPWPPYPEPGARSHYAVDKTFPITSRPPVTLATLPTAVWALAMARTTGRSDVMFGEVVSGRSTGLHASEKVVGPAWQYVPVRIKLGKGMTGTELLEAVQKQHVDGAAHECVSLREMVWETAVEGWFPPWEVTDEYHEPWFPTVVHQAVVGAGTLDFGNENMQLEMETLYPHQEPLRELKLQAFVEDGGKKMTLEIVTFEGWRNYADEILEHVGGIFKSLVESPSDTVW